MKKNIKYILGAVLVGLLGACSSEPEGPSAPAQEGSGEKNGYVLVWEDTFDAPFLNEDYWNVEQNGDGGGNNELQYYHADNITFETDTPSMRKCLVITAKRLDEPYRGKNFTSGRINTKNKVAFQKGKFEAMIKLPDTYKGLWPAWWAMGNNFDQVGWPACGEFDILEMGHQNGFRIDGLYNRYLNGAFHWGPRGDRHAYHSYSYENGYSLEDGEFHLFTWIWEDNHAACYIDLHMFPNIEPYYEFEIPSPDPEDEMNAGNYLQVPYFVILNLAVGGNFPGIYDADGITALNEENNYEASMWVDYVRIYQKAE